MNSFSNIFKKGLLLIVFSVMLLPMIQDKLNYIELPALKGDVNYPEDVIVNKSSWFTSEYQEKKETYLTSMFGLRSLFVRLNNQISYSLFNKAKANGVIIGKETYLYEKGYIDAYTGKDYLGDDSISHTLERWKFINDTLEKLNKHLIIVFAAGKASFYPDYIPDNFLPLKSKTNYKSLSDGADKLNLHVIDFNKWFVEQKHKSNYPLYPQHGVHWSTYGAALAADSLIKTIESLKKIDMPNMYFDKVNMQQPKDVDYDIADGMNLLFKFKSFDVAYPEMKIENTKGKTKPKVLVISDSFYWGMYNLGIANCFTNDHFWYYNNQVYPESSTQELLVENLDLKAELNNHEVFVIMATEATLSKISWGFTEEVEKLFKGKSIHKPRMKQDRSKIKSFIEFIKKDEKWLEDAAKRATEKNITLDSMLVLEAIWQLENKN